MRHSKLQALQLLSAVILPPLSAVTFDHSAGRSDATARAAASVRPRRSPLWPTGGPARSGLPSSAIARARPAPPWRRQPGARLSSRSRLGGLKASGRPVQTSTAVRQSPEPMACAACSRNIASKILIACVRGRSFDDASIHSMSKPVIGAAEIFPATR